MNDTKNKTNPKPVTWEEVTECCTKCIDLSKTLRKKLQKENSEKHSLSHLLAQSSKYTKILQLGISGLAIQNSEKSPPVDLYNNLRKQMENLIELETGNQALMQSNGIPLNLARTYRYDAKRKLRSYS